MRLHGMSGGGETGSRVLGKRPNLYAAYLMTSSRWDGDLEVLAQARTPVYLPYGYTSERKYNVMYLSHGGWSNETTLMGTPDSPPRLQAHHGPRH